MKHWRSLFIGTVVLNMLITGCSQPRTPQQLFDLTWSGLAGVDAFHIRGQAEVAALDALGQTQSFNYDADLDHHTQLLVKAVPGGGELSGLNVEGGDGGEGKDRAAALTLQDGSRWVMLQDGDGQSSTAWTAAAASRVNPLSAIEGLRLMKKNIRLEQGSGRGTRVLRIEPDSEQELLRIKRDLTAEMSRIQTRWSSQTYAKDSAAADSITPDTVQKGNALIEGSRKKLLELLDTAKVKTVYHLTVDKQNNLPVRLTSETRINYMDGSGKERSETLWNDAHFSDYR